MYCSPGENPASKGKIHLLVYSQRNQSEENLFDHERPSAVLFGCYSISVDKFTWAVWRQTAHVNPSQQGEPFAGLSLG